MKRRYFHSDPDELRILGLISTEVYYMMKMKEAALNFDVDEQRRLIHLRTLEQRVEKRNKAEEKQRQEKKKKEQEKAFKEAIPGTTKLIIAQRISSVMDADRIIVLHDGKLDGFGTHEELLETNTIYRDVYDSQTNGGGDFDEGGAA